MHFLRHLGVDKMPLADG